MSFETRPPPLPPFGIRELYNLRTGILHISQSQYESTVRSHPDAVLTYVDDDDGEVITVGSGLELQQRLAEPIRAAKRRQTSKLQGSASRRGSVDDSMVHLFDIQHSDNVLAIWREHEAYSSKSLRRDRMSSTESDISAAASPSPQQLDTFRAEPASAPAPALATSVPQPEPLDSQPKTHPEAQPSNPVEITNMSLAATASTKVPSNDFRQDLDTVFTAACKGLESLGLADLLDNTAQALHSLAQKTRDADASPVETLLGGFKDVVTEIGKLGLEILDDLDKGTPPPSNAHTAISTPPSENVVCKCAKKADAKLAGKRAKTALKDAKIAAKEHRREEKRARRLERVAQREARRATKKGKTQEMTTAEPEEDVGDSDEDDERTALLSPEEQTQPVLAPESSKRVSFADLQDEIRSTFTGPDTAGAEQPLPNKTSASRNDLLLSAPVLAPGLPALNLPRTLNGPVPMLPQPAANSPSSCLPTSIMDIESSNPDFTARYPPLTSLRRGQSVSELLKKNHDAAPSNIVPTTKVTLTRYPTIGQLEAQRRAMGPSGKDQVAAMQADMLRRRNQLKADSLSNNYRAQSAEDAGRYCDMPDPLLHTIPSAKAIPSATKPLPGSWPEMRCDQADLNPAIESSGAFFNRMAGLESPSAVPKRPLSPAVSCRAISPPAYQHFSSTGLHRAQTVSSSNPAARLTHPFDPLTNAPRFQPPRHYTIEGRLPERSFSLQQRRNMKPPSSAAGPGAPLLTLPPSQLPSRVPPPHPPSIMQGYPPVVAPVWHAVDDTPAPKSPSHRTPRPVRSVPNFHHQSLTPSRGDGQGFTSSPWAPNRIDECVKTLTIMGYGIQPNEAARLHVYASAAAGELDEAIDMIEEDRKAAEALNSDTATVRVL